MAFCRNCGEQISDNAKFCAVCGMPVDYTEQSTRKAAYDGVLHKSPRCGEVMKSFTAICPSCGYELRDASVSKAVQEFYEKLESAKTDELRVVLIQSYPIYNYLEWLEKAFVIYRCQRYDLQGKAVLKTQEKFYLADPALKYCMMGFNPTSIASMLENIDYFELRRRGYDVYVGKNETKEIDFVAIRRDERVYVQVCRELPDASDREIGNLLEIKDHYPKYVVTMDELAGGNIDGVRIIHLAEFLLNSQY